MKELHTLWNIHLVTMSDGTKVINTHEYGGVVIYSLPQFQVPTTVNDREMMYGLKLIDRRHRFDGDRIWRERVRLTGHELKRLMDCDTFIPSELRAVSGSDAWLRLADIILHKCVSEETLRIVGMFDTGAYQLTEMHKEEDNVS